MMFFSMQNRTMPSPRTVRIYLFAAIVLGLLGGIMPYSFAFSMLALVFSTVALLSIPRMTYSRILLVLAVMAAVTVGAVLLITRSAVSCIASVAHIPAAALLTLTIRKRYSRTCGIILGALGFGIVYLACYLVAIYVSYKGLSFEVMKELYASLKDTFITSMTDYLDSAASAYPVTLDEELLSAAFKQTMILLPSIFVVIMTGIVWLATVLVRTIFKGYLYGFQRFADWKVTMSRPVAWIFLLAILGEALSYLELSGILSAVLLNLVIILIPGFVCVGCSAIKARMFGSPNQPRSKILPLFIIVLVIGFFYLPILPLLLIALFGAVTLVAPRKPSSVPGSQEPQ